MMFVIIGGVANAQYKYINQISLDNVKISVNMSLPNSVGGRKCETKVINCSKKTVKYIYIKRLVVNDFCEYEPCEIDGEWILSSKIVGPINGNPELSSKTKIPYRYIHSYSSTELHYNSAANKSIIGYCEIIFTDGSTVEYINKNFIDVQLMKYKESMGEYYDEETCKNVILKILID